MVKARHHRGYSKACETCADADQRAKKLGEQIAELKDVIADQRETLERYEHARAGMKQNSDWWAARAEEAQSLVNSLKQRLQVAQDHAGELQKDLAFDEAALLRQREVLTALVEIKNHALNMGMEIHNQDFIGTKAWADLSWRERRRMLSGPGILIYPGRARAIEGMALRLTKSIAEFQVNVALQSPRPEKRP